VQYRSIRKCAKTGQPVACPGLRRSPDDDYGLKIKEFPRGLKNDFVFPENQGDPFTGAAGQSPESIRD